MDHLNREALRISLLEQTEGTDSLMVKPGLPYLDVFACLRQRTLLPLDSNQVNGGYSMIKFAAKTRVINEKIVVGEAFGALKVAGADIILSYLARYTSMEGI